MKVNLADMKSDLNIDLLRLKSDPLETATLEVARATSIWVARYRMIATHGEVEYWQLFEPTTAFRGEIIHVAGQTDVFLVKGNTRWPARFLGTGISSHSVLSYPQAMRCGVMKVRQVQNAVAQGLLKTTGIKQAASNANFSVGAVETINTQEAKRWVAKGDLIKFCDHAPDDLRFLASVSDLRMRKTA